MEMDLLRERIRTIIKDRGKTLKSVAAEIDMDKNYLSLMLGGKRRINEDHIVNLSNALGVTIWELFLPEVKKGEFERMENLRELIDLMEIPQVNRIIMGRLEEIKMNFKREIEEHQKKTG